jgi:hypothetical protein
MSLLVDSEPDSTVGGEKDLLFLISLLDKEDKVEFVKAFSSDFREMVAENKLSKTAYYKFLNGYAPSDERVLQITEMNEEAKEWIIKKVGEKAKKALEIIGRLGRDISADTNCISTDDKVRVKAIFIEGDNHGIIKISGDVASNSKPNTYYHAEILINNGRIRFSCSCEAGARGFLCNHVVKLYNVYRKNAKKLGGEEE